MMMKSPSKFKNRYFSKFLFLISYFFIQSSSELKSANIVQSRTMTDEEEENLEKMREERASHGKRRGAFYASPKPIPIGISPKDYIESAPNPNSWIVSKNLTTFASVKKPSYRVSCGFSETIGNRPSMEDSYCFYSHGDLDIFGIFDGHRGDSASKFCSTFMPPLIIENLNLNKSPQETLNDTYLKTNAAIQKEKIFSGTTALVGIYWKDHCFIANTGDTRAVWAHSNNGEIKYRRITSDHKPERVDETNRIIQLGGQVTFVTDKEGKVSGRVNGKLAITRSLGDFDFEPFVIPNPEIFQIDFKTDWENSLKDLTIKTNNDITTSIIPDLPKPIPSQTPSQLQNLDFLILACDGLWDVVSDSEAAIICEYMIISSNVEAAAQRLRDIAYARGSMDNITVMVLILHPRTIKKRRSCKLL